MVLIGQDPFINDNQAHGLSFSLQSNFSKIPPSIKNIFLELNRDLNINRINYNLSDWVKQGVFLLNTTLTVRKGKSLSHKNIGWEIFTDNTIDVLNKLDKKIIFVLLGKKAQIKKKKISSHHIIIETSHPSPFSFKKGFYGSGIFSNINKELKKITIQSLTGNMIKLLIYKIKYNKFLWRYIMSFIENINAYEILDSRGNPTIEVSISTYNGYEAKASVPSGASTGEYEALELRDNNIEYFLGKGVKKAIKNINTIIFDKLKNICVTQQNIIDNIMINIIGVYNIKYE